MKVSRLMDRSVVSVSEETPIKEVGRLIFSLGIGGIPVVKDGVLVGIVTEKDLLSRMFPTLQEIAEDYVHARNFNEMEKNLKAILQSPVSEILNKEVMSIKPDTEIMQAQSIMLLHKISRLPVVERGGKLVGIISQGDIFKHLLRDEIPQIEKEKYADFIGRYYDDMVNWDKRFDYEFPTIFKIFKENNVESVIDLGVWTGEYTIGLAKKNNLKLLGLDHNQLMIKISNEKRRKLPASIKKKIEFMFTNFEDLDEKIKEKYDAALCMGGSLPYIPVSPDKLFKNVAKVLRDKDAVFILQILNFRKILKAKGKLLNFRIQKSSSKSIKQHLFIEFFENLNGDCLNHHVVVFDYDGVNWIYRGLTTIEVCESSKKEIERALKKAGFKHISFSGNKGEYQGEYGELTLSKPFNEETDDWLNVVAKK